ncbi:winged helix-turn-helix domain-containing protein [uncultured Acetatifactor sp.]|jgi:two-component system alkaline phosphatase synthesis response regulator PhoP|uniref:winged helix-turn-helix domain-containing protein n=1 Tax=uncultured Acetatifactor sp. TaxID=1671927 RepID=UPI0026329EA8|nr:response regulator transcription factor [uncultured Acetatifactor sp.]
MKIWCVEDDAGIRDIEVYTLHSTDFEAEGFSDARAFRDALSGSKPDLIILDIMLPGEDGVELLKFLKGNPDTCRIPVIMATAKGMEYDKVQSLDLGADDYLVKPFGMMEMVSRVKAVLRRCKPTEVDRLLQAGKLVVNLEEHTVAIDRERIQLTLKEFELLRLFLSRPGIAFTRDQLFGLIWGADYVGETRTVDMHIRTLRMKLGDYGKMIETVRGIGYRLEVQA